MYAAIHRDNQEYRYIKKKCKYKIKKSNYISLPEAECTSVRSQVKYEIRVRECSHFPVDLLSWRRHHLFLFFNTTPHINQTEAGWENSLVTFHALRVSAIILLARTGNVTKMAAAG